MLFMEIAIAAIGIGVVLMVGYLVIAQVKSAIPTPTLANGSEDTEAVEGIASAQTTVFAGFALVAVGIIVLAAFGLINIFK